MYSKNTNNQVNSRMVSLNTASAAYVNLFKALAVFAQTLNLMFYQYSLGNIKQVAALLTRELYNNLAIKLSRLKQSAVLYPEYEYLRNGIANSLAGLNQSVIQYATMLDTQGKLVECQAQEAILYDMTKLQAFLDARKQTKYLFGEMNVTVAKAELKPVYAKYVELYGFPSGAVFEPDKLANATNLLRS